MPLGFKASKILLCHWAPTWGRKSLGRHACQMNTQVFQGLQYLKCTWPSIFEIHQCQEQSSHCSLGMTRCDGVLMFMDKVWVPDANNFRLGVCIVGHFGVTAHLSFEGTTRRISDRGVCQFFLGQLPSLQSQLQVIYPSTSGRSNRWSCTEPRSSLRFSLYSEEARVQQPAA